MSLTLALLAFSIFVLGTYIIWTLAKFDWIATICTLLVISLPFERIPSVTLGGSNIRFSQLLVVFGLWVFGVLMIKKDPQLMKIKYNHYVYFLLSHRCHRGLW
jgi:hypothetical protein